MIPEFASPLEVGTTFLANIVPRRVVVDNL
jgi:hypothetical protein